MKAYEVVEFEAPSSRATFLTRRRARGVVVDVMSCALCQTDTLCSKRGVGHALTLNKPQ